MSGTVGLAREDQKLFFCSSHIYCTSRKRAWPLRGSSSKWLRKERDRIVNPVSPKRTLGKSGVVANLISIDVLGRAQLQRNTKMSAHDAPQHIRSCGFTTSNL